MNYFVGNGIAKYCATGLASTLMAVQSLLPASAATPSKDDYPSRPITLVVPSDAGAATDTMARSLANQLAKALNQPVVVENRPGASGAIGASHVARAAPDGYTLLVGPGTAMVVNPMVNKTDYDVDRDFRPIGLLVDAEMVMVARPSTGFKTLGDVLQYAKAHPGKLSYASFGYGSTFHLSMEYLQQKTGTEFLHVPYKGGGATVSAMLGGQIDVMFANTSYVLSQIRSGQMTALAIPGFKRSTELPDVPLASDTVPGYQVNTWIGLYAPVATSDAIVAKLNAATNAYLRDPKSAATLQALGLVPMPGSVEDAKRFQDAERVKWRGIIAGVKPKAGG